MMGVQTPAMAAETMQESATQEAVTQESTQELQVTESQNEEIPVEEVPVEEVSAEEAEIEELSAQEDDSETQTAESQLEEQVEVSENQEFETQVQQADETQSEESQEIAETVTQESETIGESALTGDEEVLTEGWHQDSDGNRTYVKDGELVKDQIIQVEGKCYGFDKNGILLVNREFSLYLDSHSQTYRAKMDGSLYINEWYIQSGEVRSYYGDDGAEYNRGLYEIDGKKYYFEYDHVSNNCCVSVDGVDYICREDGAMEPVPENAWITIKQQTYTNTYYTQNGKLLKNCVVQIDNNYYAFSQNGLMYSDHDGDSKVRMWNDETKKYDCYRVGKDGRLYVNEWYETYDVIEGSRYYYYGEDGKAYSGFHEIDGVQYYFFDGYNGEYMQKNANFTVDGVNYFSDSTGRAVELQNNQWTEIEGKYHYVKDGEALTWCRVEIDGVQYKFDRYGIWTPEEEPSEEPTGWFKNESNDWCYRGEDGNLYKDGLYEINGKPYYFTWSGSLYVSKVFSVGEKCYFADENGYLTELSDGWFFANGSYYYIQNNKILSETVEEIDGSYYGFNSNGKMYANQEFSIESYEHYKYYYKYYRAKVDGSLYVSEWYWDESEQNWYYYDEAGEQNRDLKKNIDGVDYIFESSGKLAINCTVGSYMSTATGYEGHFLLSDENGVWISNPGWIQKNNRWYYIKEDGTLFCGLLNDNGHQYYMGPEMYTDTDFVIIDGENYSIDANGWVRFAENGFHTDENNLWYISDGEYLQNWNCIDENWYYFRYDYSASSLRNDIYHALKDGIYNIGGRFYYFNKDGIMASNGWIFTKEGDWYYALASGELATGDMKLNGTLYHFDSKGKLKTGVTVADGICRLYNQDGAVLENGNLDGWNIFAGNYYYVQNGALLKSGSYKLMDGNWYAFDKKGKMLSDVLAGDRWYSESGAASVGWILSKDGNWYYADTKSARLYKGFRQVGAKQYYFNEDGIMLTGETVINGKLVIADENGAITVQVVPNGWSIYGEEWYYYKNGTPYTGWVGEYYVDNGKMVHNGKAGSGYVDENGCRIRNSWVNDGKSYVDAKGILAYDETLEINGKLYCFDKYEVKYGLDQNNKGKIYLKDGGYISVNSQQQGWSYIDDNWYYKLENKFLCDESRQIYGDWYQFDAYGRMVTGYYNAAYYNADGRRVFYTGWQVIDGNWYYFNANSEAVDGWQLIGGVKYYFGKTSHFMYTGYKVIDGDLYYFDASGASQGISESVTGWHQQDGDWYYIRNGHVVTGASVIDGTLYKFNDNGIWIS